MLGATEKISMVDGGGIFYVIHVAVFTLMVGLLISVSTKCGKAHTYTDAFALFCERDSLTFLTVA